jgi:hypothetical protein
MRNRQKINPIFCRLRQQKRAGKARPFLEEKAREPQSWTGFALFLYGLKAGKARLQTQINPAKSRVLLFGEH